jgi:uncharacterized YigZ family protein
MRLCNRWKRSSPNHSKQSFVSSALQFAVPSTIFVARIGLSAPSNHDATLISGRMLHHAPWPGSFCKARALSFTKLQGRRHACATVPRDRPLYVPTVTVWRASSGQLEEKSRTTSANSEQAGTSVQRTLAEGLYESEVEIKKSRFIGYAATASSWENAQTVLQQVRSRHAKARHVCFGYRGANKDSRVLTERSDDDGEPGGTAGAPILGAIAGEGLVDTICIVVRYFGGIKLGAGGLIRAYGRAAREVLRQTDFEEVIPSSSIRVRAGTMYAGAVFDAIVKVGASRSQEAYEDDGTFLVTITCDSAKVDRLRSHLVDITRGSISFVNQETGTL